jgi:hypothetical protein
MTTVAISALRCVGRILAQGNHWRDGVFVERRSPHTH